MTGERRRMPAIALIGVLVGMAIPTGAGCIDQCPELRLEGAYWISAGERADWVTGSGRMEVTETTILFSYTTTDGSVWEVEYERTETLGD